jgi:hypothetical protein
MNSFRHLVENYQASSICKIRIPEGEKKEKGEGKKVKK